MATLTEACGRIEENNPPVSYVQVYCRSRTDVDGELFISVELFPGDYYQDYTLSDVGVWRRLGKAIQGTHLERFWFSVLVDFEDVTPPAAACLDALFGQIKYARSIYDFNILLGPSNRMQMFDLRQFAQSNLSLQKLEIESPRRI